MHVYKVYVMGTPSVGMATTTTVCTKGYPSERAVVDNGRKCPAVYRKRKFPSLPFGPLIGPCTRSRRGLATKNQLKTGKNCG